MNTVKNNSFYNSYFCILSSCKVVIGANASAIYDLQAKAVHAYPRWVGVFMLKYNGVLTIDELIQDGEYSEEEIELVISMMVGKKFAILTKWPDVFLFDEESVVAERREVVIDAAIVDVEKGTNLEAHLNFIYDISEAGCNHIDIRVYNYESIGEIIVFLDNVNKIVFQQLCIYINILADDVNEISRLSSEKEISKIYCFLKKNDNIKYLKKHNNIEYFNGQIDINSCGKVNLERFNVSNENFYRAKHFNECLHGKIGIDTQGVLKNCPSQQKGFGPYKKSTFIDIINSDDFLYLQNIKKDDVGVCQDCIYRYCCTDCRVFVDESGKPSKCGYDPYTNIWSVYQDGFTKLN